VKRDSVIHSMPSVFKIIFMMIMVLVILAFDNFSSYGVVLAFLLFLILLSKVPLSQMVSGIRKLYLFILFSFFMPVLFNSGGEPLAALGPIKITQTGLYTGAAFSFRIILLMLGAALLIKTTSPAALAKGIKGLLRPFKIIGISGERTSKIITSSLITIPIFWERAQNFIKNYKFNCNKIKGLILGLSSLILIFYQQIDE